MSPRNRTSISSVQIIIGLLVLVAAGAVAAILFAPSKPAAPPVSRMSIEERPQERVTPKEVATAPEETPEAPAPAPVQAATAKPALPQATPTLDAVGTFRVNGSVKERDSQEPISGVIVLAIQSMTAEQEADCSARLEAAKATGEADAVAAAERACEEIAVSQPTYQGVSNNLGAYEIKVPEPGDYKLWIPSRQQYAPQRRQVAKYEAKLGTLDESRAEITHDVTIDLTAAVSGRVTETGGSIGAPDVKVILLDASAKNALADMVTLEDGSYELPVREPGEYAVRVELGRSAYRMGDLIPFRRVKVPEPDSLVEGIDFTVDPAGVVWGYVTTPDGDPVPNSEVVLCTSESPLSQFVTAALRRTPPVAGRSQDDGYYELLGVPLQKEWQLYANSDSNAPQLAQPFVLTPANRSLRIDVYMFPGSLVRGIVVDERGRPVPEARIRCIPNLSSLVAPFETAYAFRDTRCDANGEFFFEEVPAGGYNIYAQSQGYKFDTAGVPIYPDGYTELNNVRVVLYAIEAGEHEIFGTVVDAEGNGISGVDVAINGLALDSMTRVEQATTTSASGEFRFSQMPKGRYSAVFTKETYGTVRRAGMALDRENKVIMSQASLVRGRVLVRETGQPPLQYSVQAAKTAEYSEGGSGNRITMGGGGGGQNVGGQFSNPDGSFELFLTPGDYLLTATSDQLTPGRTNVVVEPGGAVDDVVIYVTQSGGTLRGVIRTMDGRSPQGAVAELVDLSGGLAALAEGGSPIETSYTVGEDGAFVFERLPAGSYIVTAQFQSDTVLYAKATTETIVLGEGETRDDLVLTLGSGGVLTGRVCTSDGEPWAGASVLIGSADSATLRDATTDESGNFQVDGLSTGEYTVTAIGLSGANMLGGERPTRSVRVEEGQTSEVDFCSEGIRLTGVCNPPPPGGVLAGGQIFLRQPGTPTIEQQFQGREAEFLQTAVQGGDRVDAQGFYELTGLPPGTYQLEVVYFSFVPGAQGAFQEVYVGMVELTGDQPVVQYDIEVNAE